MKLYISYHLGFTDEQLDKLRELGFEIRIGDITREAEPCPSEYFDAEAVIGYRLFNGTDISNFKNLRLIHTTSSGTDHLPHEYIREHGIRVYNSPGVYSVPMAEFALCGVLRLYKRSLLFEKQQQEHVWQQYRGLMELMGKRVLIVGAGSIGEETAKRFSAMGCHVTGLCRHPSKRAGFDEVKSISELDGLIPDSDIVMLCLPLTDETRHMFNQGRFALMKQDSVFINLARGAIVDTPALIAALEGEKLLGAIIDVCEEEPLPAGSPLWDEEKCILTPHNSFYGTGNNDRLFAKIYSDFEGYLRENGR